MPRSRYRIREMEYPYFLTCTVGQPRTPTDQKSGLAR